MSEIQQLDHKKVEAFFGKVFGDIKSTALGMNIYLGDKLGLFKAMSEAPAGTFTEDSLVKTTGLQPRYLKEWLSSMVVGGIVDFNAETNTFSFPIERALVLANENSPVFVSGIFEMFPTWYMNTPKVAEHFRTGGGVQQKEYGEEFWRGFERFTRAQFLNHMAQEWLPAMHEVHKKLLEHGGKIADVGCGNGQAALILAGTYPKAKVTGFDNYAPAIKTANERAKGLGVGDRVEYQVADAVDGLPGAKYDLITTFDAIHDMVDPVGALKGIRHSLTDDGTYLWHEFNVSSDLVENMKNPIGLPVFLYSASTNYCTTSSLSQGGAAYGACLGEKNARKIANEAGFTDFKRLPVNDLLAALYQLKP
jgi:ubiquinone/menaquinone biosynthesis C-methylase UbiE